MNKVSRKSIIIANTINPGIKEVSGGERKRASKKE